MFDLSGRVALVTGGSRGIGREISRQLAKYGAAVAVNYHTGEEQAHSIRKEIEGEGGKAIVVQGDVRRPEDAERMMQAGSTGSVVSIFW